MKHFYLATAAAALMTSAAVAEDVKLGVSLGFTGPLESMSPPMAQGAELAAAEVSGDANFMDGGAVEVVRGDSTCADAQAAVATVDRLISEEGVKGIVGGMCSGETIASLENSAMPNGVVMISPSATSPALTTIEDNGLFFRTSPSDARQGIVMAEIAMERGVENVAITYTNNDYGKGLADSFAAAFEEKGGSVTINTAHEDGKGDYSAEVAALAAAGGDALAIVGYIDQGGSGVLRASLDTGAFDTFIFPDGMVGANLEENFSSELDGSFGQLPSSQGEGRDRFTQMATDAGFDGTQVFSAEAYDAAALMLLSMAQAGSAEPGDWKGEVMGIANEPGEQILPGELAKGLEIIANGGEVDYVGATSVELIEPGESSGTFREIEFVDGEMGTAGYR